MDKKDDQYYTGLYNIICLEQCNPKKPIFLKSVHSASAATSSRCSPSQLKWLDHISSFSHVAPASVAEESFQVPIKDVFLHLP